MAEFRKEDGQMSAVSTGAVIEKLNYSHNAMIDLIVANPMIQQGELARRFGYTQPWISRILRSDSFREALAARTKELVDPLVLQSIEQRFEALVHQSLDVLEEKLHHSPTADLALKSAELSARVLGYGARPGAAVSVQQTFVVAMPQKAESSEKWLEENRPGRQGGMFSQEVPGRHSGTVARGNAAVIEGEVKVA